MIHFSEALKRIYVPKGISSVIHGIMTVGDHYLPHQEGLSASLSQCDVEIAKYDKALRECQSDAAYWSILSDAEYWRAVKDILIAGTINEDGMVADIPAPDTKTIVMDAITKVRQYGKQVLAETVQQGLDNNAKTN